MRWSKRNRNIYYKSKIVQYVRPTHILVSIRFSLLLFLCKAIEKIKQKKKSFFFYSLCSRLLRCSVSIHALLPTFWKSKSQIRNKPTQRKKGDERELEKCTHHKGYIVIAIYIYICVCWCQCVWLYGRTGKQIYVFR